MKILHIAECAGDVERYLSMLLPLLEQRNLKQYAIIMMINCEERRTVA